MQVLSLYIVHVLCAIYHFYLCTITHVYVLFPVWSSVPVHADWQSNALTPSICSMVTTSMDVMSYVYGCKLSMLLVRSHLYSSAKCVVCIHTVHGHRQVFWVCLNYNTCFIYIYIYVHAYNIMHIFSCDNYYCPCDTFSSLTLDTLYICTLYHIACSNHFEISTVQ